MSVEKFYDQDDFDANITHEPIPYTQINNEVINQLRDLEVLGVWIYLSSKPKNWKIVKAHLKNHFNIGNQKIKQIFSKLHMCKLIEYVQIKQEKGHFAQVEIRVLNGSKFVNIQEDAITPARECTGGSLYRPPVNRTTGSSPLQIKKHTNKEKHKEKNNQKLLSASIDAQARFDEFWKAYPRKVNKLRTKKLWFKLKLDEKAETILADISLRKAKDCQWQQIQYIPHPTTYLNGARWEDEITEPTQAAPKGMVSAPNNQSKSTFASVSSQSTSYIPYEEQQRRDREAKIRHEELMRTYQ